MFGSRLEVRRFDDEIQKYLERPIETGKILFYGDSLFTRSSFTYCNRHLDKNLPLMEEELLAKDGSKVVLNHGFGTSSADDLLYYYSRLVRPYAPRALFLATGANDIGFGYSASEIMNITATLIDWFQADFPGVPIYIFKRIKSLKNAGLTNRATRIRAEVNELMEDYVAEKEGITIINQIDMPFYYADPADIGDQDKMRPEIYDTDQVHFNREGYLLFIDYLRNFMEKEGLL